MRIVYPKRKIKSYYQRLPEERRVAKVENLGFFL